jgi:hypothetical protein
LLSRQENLGRLRVAFVFAPSRRVKRSTLLVVVVAHPLKTAKGGAAESENGALSIAGESRVAVDNGRLILISTNLAEDIFRRNR